MMEKICSTQHCLRNCVCLQIPMTFFLSFNHIVNKNLQLIQLPLYLYDKATMFFPNENVQASGRHHIGTYLELARR